MLRFVTIIIVVLVGYFVFRHLMRVLKQRMCQGNKPGDYQYQNSGHANTEEEYRKILGVTNRDTPATIKARYKDLLTKYHPDKVQHLGVEFQEMAERKTKAIMEAYEFLQKKYSL
jgi:DnaJ-domain-containing protein 1